MFKNILWISFIKIHIINNIYQEIELKKTTINNNKNYLIIIITKMIDNKRIPTQLAKIKKKL